MQVISNCVNFLLVAIVWHQLLSFTLSSYCSVFNRNQDLQEVTLEKEGKVVLRFAIANGFRNIQNLVQKLKRGKCTYDYVEVMACPSGMVET